jgi:hypothetical protein
MLPVLRDSVAVDLTTRQIVTVNYTTEGGISKKMRELRK